MSNAPDAKRRAATPSTVALHEAVRGSGLDWADTQDFEDARRGFIARLDSGRVTSSRGDVVWDLAPYGFLDAEQAPATVNPSLWRLARLNMEHGLFKVTDRLYQVRGMDLSVMSFIEADSGWIVVDPLVSAEVAEASLGLVREHVDRRPVVAVIYTHSHLDHWGGVKGVTTDAEVAAGRCQVIAPEGFVEAAVSENLYAGNVMGRRASYMYGNLLARDPMGSVDGGLGKTTSSGTIGLVPPTRIVTRDGERLRIDGIELEFQLTPGTEAPSEMNFYLPALRALCMAENCTHTLHNLYTLRGAQVRDALAWSKYLNEAIERYADRTEVVFASHHWPCWGADRCRALLESQRDLYRFLHDQTLHYANQGFTSLEIAEMLELPPALARAWHNRGYYGSVSHDVKAVYQKYLGFFDGNPANLQPLPPAEAGRRYVELAGGAEALLTKAQGAFERGEYRWVAELVNHLVFADPGNQPARELQAASLEQLGYQTECASWRNYYLSGAKELRQGVEKVPVPAPPADILAQLGIDMLLDVLAIRLDGRRAGGTSLAITLEVTDLRATHAVELANGVLNHTEGRAARDSQLTVTASRAALLTLLAGGTKQAEALVASGQVVLEGRHDVLGRLVELLDEFGFWFDLVTP